MHDWVPRSHTVWGASNDARVIFSYHLYVLAVIDDAKYMACAKWIFDSSSMSSSPLLKSLISWFVGFATTLIERKELVKMQKFAVENHC